MKSQVYKHQRIAAGRKPNSVPVSAGFRRLRRATTIPLAPPSLAGSSDRPGGDGRAVRTNFSRRIRRQVSWRASLFGLAPCGVLPATDLTAGAVRSYRTFSPLPEKGVRPLFGAHP